MEIVACTDHGFIMPTGVMMQSICVNSPIYTEYNELSEAGKCQHILLPLSFGSLSKGLTFDWDSCFLILYMWLK